MSLESLLSWVSIEGCVRLKLGACEMDSSNKITAKWNG